MSMTDTQQRARARMLTQVSRRRATLSARRIALRRFAVMVAKLGLPLLALVLLSAVAFWPEFVRIANHSRTSFKRVFALQADNGRMLEPHYKGVDERGRPYTLTATWAEQAGQNRVNLGDPKGDMVLQSGNWLQVEGRTGVFIQHAELLDLSGAVVLYRDDGLVMHTETAAVDIKQGAATSNDMTHAEGPFGVLDAQGFMLTDKGGNVQFQGPARLILNGASK